MARHNHRAEDTTATPIGSGGVETADKSESYYWLDGRRLSRAFGHNLPARPADLVDIAMAVYYHDRRVKRVRTPLVLTGQRNFRIPVLVRDLDFWSDHQVTQRLSDVLYWFTEDAWEFEFGEIDPRYKRKEDAYLFESPVRRPNVTCLFSGGLDSFAGACILLQDDPNTSVVLVGGSTHRRLESVQRRLIKALTGTWQSESRELRSIIIPFGIRLPKDGHQQERSQRTRGFVFMALGTVAAAMAGSSALYVNENGVGSINLRYNEGQLGVDSSRGSHPLSMVRMEELFSLVSQKRLPIEDPFQFQTKGQMCRRLASANLARLAKLTVSCDGYPLRIRGSPSQCGICTSCLLRRLALDACGLNYADDGTGFRYDVKNPATPLKMGQLYPLQAMLTQASVLRQCLDSTTPWEALTQIYPELVQIQQAMSDNRDMDAHQISKHLINMYRTYVGEWQGFARNIPIATLSKEPSK